MIRSYCKVLRCHKVPSVKNAYSEIMDLKIAEAIENVQIEGGLIKSASLIPSGGGGYVYTLFILYEDNGNFSKIDNLLRNLIFNFDELK